MRDRDVTNMIIERFGLDVPRATGGRPMGEFLKAVNDKLIEMEARITYLEGFINVP